MKRSYLPLALIITFSIAFLSLIKLGKQPINISHLDKLEHLIAYFFLGISWLLSFRKYKEFSYKNYLIVLVCVFYGIIIEVLQTTLTTYREASVLDIVANTVGVLLALLFFNKVFEKKQAI
ncbi:MAG: VanZ family protein [Flavobacteriaceae bacterium]